MIKNEELDVLGEAVVQHRLDRGDYCDQGEIFLSNHGCGTLQRNVCFLTDCERAGVSSARDAKLLAILGNLIALSALIVSIFALIKA